MRTQCVNLVYFPFLTCTCHISYPNLTPQNVHDFLPGHVCSLCSLRLERPPSFPIPSLLMTSYPSSWTIASTTYFCLHSQDSPFAPKPKQCFLLAGSPLMVLTSFHHASWSFVCSPLSASFQNVISLRAVIRNHSSMNSCIHSFNHLPIQQLFVYYWFNNTIEHLTDIEGRFRYWGSKDKRD